MNKLTKGTNDYLAQLVLALVGVGLTVLVTAVPALAPYQEVLLEILAVVVALIFGVSIQKAGK
jgi:hypothetical protein